MVLVIAVFCSASASILGTFYNRKGGSEHKTALLYSSMQMSSIFMFWCILYGLDRTVHLGVLPYAVLASVCFLSGIIGLIKALECGSTLLTSLILQLSTICVAVWGFFFWNSPLTLRIGIGLLLVCISLGLCLYSGKNKKEKTINLKWLIYVGILFGGNAGFCIVQKTQQMNFEGKYGNFFMFTATGIAAVTCGMLYLKIKRGNVSRKNIWYFPVSAGVCNGILNLCLIVLATSTLSTSLIYPMLSIGSLIIVTVFSKFVWKEKTYWWQWIGVVTGMVAAGLLAT